MSSWLPRFNSGSALSLEPTKGDKAPPGSCSGMSSLSLSCPSTTPIGGPDAAWLKVISSVADRDETAPEGSGCDTPPREIFSSPLIHRDDDGVQNSVVGTFGIVCEILELERQHQEAIKALRLEAERRSMGFEDERQRHVVAVLDEREERERCEYELAAAQDQQALVGDQLAQHVAAVAIERFLREQCERELADEKRRGEGCCDERVATLHRELEQTHQSLAHAQKRSAGQGDDLERVVDRTHVALNPSWETSELDRMGRDAKLGQLERELAKPREAIAKEQCSEEIDHAQAKEFDRDSERTREALADEERSKNCRQQSSRLDAEQHEALELENARDALAAERTRHEQCERLAAKQRDDLVCDQAEFAEECEARLCQTGDECERLRQELATERRRREISEQDVVHECDGLCNKLASERRRREKSEHDLFHEREHLCDELACHPRIREKTELEFETTTKPRADLEERRAYGNREMAQELERLRLELDCERNRREKLERELTTEPSSRRKEADEELRRIRTDLADERQKCESCERNVAAVIERVRGDIDDERSRQSEHALVETRTRDVDRHVSETQKLRDELTAERARREACEKELVNQGANVETNVSQQRADLDRLSAELTTERHWRSEFERQLDEHARLYQSQLETNKARADRQAELESELQRARDALDNERTRRRAAKKHEIALKVGSGTTTKAPLNGAMSSKSRQPDDELERARKELASLELEVQCERQRREASDQKLVDALDRQHQCKVDSCQQIEHECEARSKCKMQDEDRRQHRCDLCPLETERALVSPPGRPDSVETSQRQRERCEMRSEDERIRFLAVLSRERDLRRAAEQKLQDDHNMHLLQAIADFQNIKGELKRHCDLRAKRRGYANAELARQAHQTRENEINHELVQARSVSKKPSFERPKRSSTKYFSPKLRDCYVVGKHGLKRRRMMYHLPGCKHLMNSNIGGDGGGGGKEFPMTIDEIRYMEHRPCPFCGPTPIGVLNNRLLL